MIYEYEKTNVNIEALNLEINQSEVITTDLISITFVETNDLDIEFDGTLTSTEEDELDSIVSSHTGQALTHYRLYCNDCENYRSTRYNSTPSECPACEGTDITNIVAQYPHCLCKDESQNEWEIFVVSDGTMILARRY